ncbi:lytic transglycosylase domain-containing protein [Virgibacillus salexigens]|uniref:Murein hydrolase B n=1 Tax=Virgibacillus massiliensis TaxID=1462526 RepID=A0A024QHZ7_9BACI|nr:lytic transglycosylase domain-containing protein [Virgibacillus massiliensis]CDQ42124.1 murein hydrolase B [Virgibacillus massiliensis]
MLYMRKVVIGLIALLLFPSVAAASELQESKSYYDDKLQKIEQEIEQTKDKERLIELSRKENELAAYQRAYQKAIENQNNVMQLSVADPSYTVDYDNALPHIELYKAAAKEYHIDWALLAAIHDVETSFSTHPTMISSVGALGHMQFMPGTWEYYGVDADGDGKADPYSLSDSVYSAANYLAASGAANGHITKALFAYNRSTKYGIDVMAKAEKYREIGEMNK